MQWPFCFYKAGPTDHAVKFVAGTKRKEGLGAMYLVGPRTTVVVVPTTDQAVTFMFTERTSDGQELAVQGEIHLKLDVEAILKRRDYSVDPKSGNYLSDDPEKVADEGRYALQAFVRRAVENAPHYSRH